MESINNKKVKFNLISVQELWKALSLPISIKL